MWDCKASFTPSEYRRWLIAICSGVLNWANYHDPLSTKYKRTSRVTPNGYTHFKRTLRYEDERKDIYSHIFLCGGYKMTHFFLATKIIIKRFLEWGGKVKICSGNQVLYDKFALPHPITYTLPPLQPKKNELLMDKFSILSVSFSEFPSICMRFSRLKWYIDVDSGSPSSLYFHSFGH